MDRRKFLQKLILGGSAVGLASCTPFKRREPKGGPGIDGLEEHFEPGLALELPLIFNGADISGYDRHGTLNNVSFVSDASFGKAAYFNGYNSYVKVPTNPEFSFANTGGLTVSFWANPTTLDFSKVEGDNYINYAGKGDIGKHEYYFRMYNKNSSRPCRSSFYLFNPQGGLGIGSYVQETPRLGNWMFLTGVVDSRYTHMYKNGVLRDSDDWHNSNVGGSYISITPKAGDAPVRIGTYNGKSFFKGKIVDFRIYKKALSQTEVSNLFKSYYT